MEARSRINTAAFIAGIAAAYALPAVGHFPGAHELPRPAALIATFAYPLLPVVVLAAIIIRWEHLPLASAGWRLPTKMEILPALLGFVASMGLGLAADGLCWIIFGIRNPNPPLTGLLERVLLMPVWMRIGLVIVDAFIEECGRGYVVERFASLTGSIMVGGMAAFVGSIMIHAVGDLKWVYTFVPSQFAFVALYLWRRNVSTCVIAHSLLDGSVLVIAPMFVKL
jgi:Type II CAAX prenyl endopeptidase Rce1-like